MRFPFGRSLKDIPLSILVMLIAAGYFLFPSCTENSEPTLEKVTIAEGQQQSTALVYVAKDKGFFRAEGLDVTLQPRSSGKECLAAVLEGKADLATVAETPLMFAGLKGEKIFTIATISESSRAMAVVARRDRRILAPADLKGKTVGVTFGTNGEYFLYAFRIFHGLPDGSLRIVDTKPGDMVDALTKGRIDAATVWAPHTTRLLSALGDAGETFEGGDIYTMTFNLAATRDYVRKNPKAVAGLLRAMLKSESFARDYPGEAAGIVASNIGAPPAAVRSGWDTYRYDVTLRQSLLTTMEAQARWALRKNPATSGNMPNYLDFIYFEGLSAVRPESVTVTR